MSPDRYLQPALYLGRLYTPQTGGGWLYLEEGAFAVGPTGRIEEVGPVEGLLSRFPDHRRIDYRSDLLIPGLVDCHQHLCHYCWTRLVPNLQAWLEHIYPLEMAFEDAGHAGRVARRFFADLVRNGTTTCCVHGPYFAEATEAAFQAADRAGLHVIMGMNAGDHDLPSPLRRPAEASTRDAIELHRRWDGAAGGRLAYAFTVRPAYCASATLLRLTAAAAGDRGAQIQCHLAEDAQGKATILRRFPACGAETQVYAVAGLLGPRTIMAHGVYLEAEDRDRLAASATALVHCPRANLLAGGKQMELLPLRERGIRVGLGSDLGGGKGLSLFRVMEDALKVTPSLSVHDVFRMASLEGAGVLGLADRTGSLESGKLADFVVTRPKDVNDFPGAPATGLDDWLSGLAFRGDPHDLAAVYVGGRLVGDEETCDDD